MPDYKSIEEFDEAAEKEYLENLEETEETEEIEEVEETDEQEEIQENVQEDENVITEDDIEEEEQEEEPEEEEPEEQKPNKVTAKKPDKKEYAFKELRKERDTYKKKYGEVETLRGEYDTLAKSLGYSNAEELLKAEKDKRAREEAKSKGVDPAFYTEFQEMKEELAKEKKSKEQAQKTAKLEIFNGALDNIIKTNEMTSQDKIDILNEMEKDGYDINDLYEIKNPKRFIEGYAYDKVVEKEKQKIIKKQKKQEFVEKPFNSTKKGKETKSSLQKQLIDEEMRAYAKEHGLSYIK